jgi:hypothetical protein
MLLSSTAKNRQVARFGRPVRIFNYSLSEHFGPQAELLLILSRNDDLRASELGKGANTRFKLELAIIALAHNSCGAET